MALPDSLNFDGTDFDPTDRAEWPLHPGLHYLNHGTVGVAPKRILRHRADLLLAVEADPAAVVVRGLADIYNEGWDEPSLTRRMLASVSEFVNADIEGLAFVDNITTGANAVLRSLIFDASDELLVTSLGYGGIDNTVQATADRTGATLRRVEMPPLGSPSAAFTDAIIEAITPNTRLVVLDHLAANSALVLPILEMVRACRQRGVITLVDGAHVPGSLPLDVAAIGADFYTANLHKWALVPRGVAFLWIAPEYRTQIHPAVTSWGYGRGLEAEFDFTGTRDPTAIMSVPAALSLFATDGMADIYERNAVAARDAARYLSLRWQTEFTTPDAMIGPMAAVRLPAEFGNGAVTATALQHRLRTRESIEVPIASGVDPNLLTARVSCQRYVTHADIEAFGDAIDRALGDVVKGPVGG